jgi:hypothetical protein
MSFSGYSKPVNSDRNSELMKEQILYIVVGLWTNFFLISAVILHEYVYIVQYVLGKH